MERFHHLNETRGNLCNTANGVTGIETRYFSSGLICQKRLPPRPHLISRKRSAEARDNQPYGSPFNGRISFVARSPLPISPPIEDEQNREKANYSATDATPVRITTSLPAALI